MTTAVYQKAAYEMYAYHSATKTLDIDDKTQPKAIWGSALSRQHTPLTFLLTGLNVELAVELNERIILGRKSPDTQTLVNLDFTPYQAVDKGVSRVHATLYRVNNTVHILDMNSSNGTFLNGRRLTPYQERILRDGDEVSLGKLAFVVRF
jgi:hypothetical protein